MRVDWTVPDPRPSWSVTLVNGAGRTPFQWLCRTSPGEDPETLAIEEYRLVAKAAGLSVGRGTRVLEKRLHAEQANQAWIGIHDWPHPMPSGESDPRAILRDASRAIGAAILTQAAEATLPREGEIVASLFWGHDGSKVTISTSLLWSRGANEVEIAAGPALRRRINAIMAVAYRRADGGGRRVTGLKIPASASARANLSNVLRDQAAANAARADAWPAGT